MSRLAVLGLLVVCACLDVPEPSVEQPGGGGATDGAPAADDPATLSCDQIFGSASDYHLCAATDDRCEFYTSSGGDPCRQICDSFGAACLDAWDADEPDLCVEQNADDCDGERGDIVCVCARA